MKLRIDKGDKVEMVFTASCESVLEISKPDGEQLYARVKKAIDGESIAGAQQVIWHDGETVTETFDCPTNSSPAQVATKAYRDGYERVFGKYATGAELN